MHHHCSSSGRNGEYCQSKWVSNCRHRSSNCGW
ncbi:hypothetical protein D3X12_18935 [Pseudomonas protegens]|uniref:Invertebrate defensins family profile domain-containing protein n=1 Tax=Pseudomonas protegens TaxID=380021 RepID=A0ABY2VQH0_9PSED|nr:hypothetical protein D3X12_18935 [Pseudomonas protegens]QEZ55320.1 hypothetical protein D4N38_00545 [Pseudomonas protegens]QEZ63889.1 hypothetical protein D4N37_14255 [Pseudomonas protegens]QIC32257.1 hypothetical protein FQ342_28685 [Pseudomonas protegens]TMM66326.1 hypothetical protein FEF10_02365 [Pseudomonas protegens]